ncbi:hypothetical protein [Bradyrhizobium sp. CCBAU 51627]|uniref:hypothetical protein n=1 Tax=Bradyrhizobium sp. CCBAU 51627 TaxID=1325088 RepID=UPI0023060DD2|nr:hypothetical protein [Bradyrhizobium sp. CCBAU 51627]MDA9434077.1 hypothetical protein [Bradyrhizobium sp. CCBAU 51627]
MTSKLIPPLLAALLLALLPDVSAAARSGIISIHGHSHPSPTEGRQIAAPPWSAACMTDHGPSECGEPMWIYGPRSGIAQYRSAF